MNKTKNSEKRLIKNTVILSICTFLNRGLMFLMVPFFTRWISVEEYGTYDVFSTYVLLLIPVITLSTSNSIFRLSIDKDDQTRNDYIKNGLILYLFNYFIAVALIVVLYCFFHFNLIVPFIILLSAELLDNYFQGYLRALKKLPLYGICKSLSVVTIAITVTVLVKFMNLGLVGLIYGYSAGFLVSSIIIIFVTRYWKYISNSKFSAKKIKDLISYSWPLIPNDIAWWVINVSDRQIINTFIGSVANGIYAVAYKLPNLCSSVFGVFNVSWQESATENVNEKDNKFFYESILNKTISILLSLCIGIVSCNFLFFDFIFDSRYSTARLYTPFLIASVIFSTLSLFYGGIQISLKRPKANGLSTVIGAISNVLVHLAFVKYIGLYAAAISTLVSNIVVFVIRERLLRDKYIFKIDKKQYFYSLVFIYISIMAMFKMNLYINILNLAIASVVFIYINKDIILNIIKKFKKS